MASAEKPGVLGYVDEQIDALNHHVPAALDDFDPTGIHQSRVATRRLKAALDLLGGWGEAPSFDAMKRGGKKLRRLLGPLRDADVMIQNLGACKVPDRLRPAADWLAGVLRAERDELHGADAGKKSADKRLKQFAGWWADRRTLEANLGDLRGALVQRLAAGATVFAAKADRAAGGEQAPDAPPLDVHELRIDGKALRYTFELAAASGVKVPKRIFKTFKAMQESLGTWHDFVVLAEATTAQWAKQEVALHNPQRAGEVLDLAKLFLKDSTKALQQFKGRWKRSGAGIMRVIGKLRSAAEQAHVNAPPAVPHPPATDAPSGPATP